MISIVSFLSTPASADALSEYATRRLVCWSETRYQSTTQFYEDGTVSTNGGDYRVWGVKDGRGHVLDTVTFGRMIGDDEHVAEISDAAERHKRTGRTMTIGGVAVLAAGGAGVLLGRSAESFAISYGSLLAASGGLALGGYGLAVSSSAKAPLMDVTRAYDYGMAAQRCDSYNQAIREELGLTREDTHLLDTASLTWPDERVRHLVVRPVFAPNAVGIVGSF